MYVERVQPLDRVPVLGVVLMESVEHPVVSGIL